MTLGFVISLILHGNILLSPETIGNVFKYPVDVTTIKTLVGGDRLQRTKMLDIGSHLDVVEVLLVDGGRDNGLAAVPCHLELGVLLVDILCQQVDALRVVVAAHEGEAGDVLAILIDEGIDGIGIQGEADVFPKVMAVTPRTVTRAIGNVNCQCHFVGYLLKYYASVDVLQHRLVCHSVVTACGLLLTGL